MQHVDYPLNDQGAWCEILTRPPPGRTALFLDRDGTVVEEVEYLYRAEDVRIISGAADVIATANAAGIPVVLVTNQAGIGRGYYGWAEFRAVQQALGAALAAQGARLDAIYACPHHRDGRGCFAHPDHPLRKPNPGMLLQAALDLSLDLRHSWLVGDKEIDVEAAKRAGIAGAMHVATGHGIAEARRVAALATPMFEIRFGCTIADAIVLPLFSDRAEVHR